MQGLVINRVAVMVQFFDVVHYRLCLLDFGIDDLRAERLGKLRSSFGMQEGVHSLEEFLGVFASDVIHEFVSQEGFWLRALVYEELGDALLPDGH